jgi:ABC-2 type transport system permease protein
MMGKLLGATGTVLALAVIYIGAACGFAAYFDVLNLIPLSLFFWFFFFLILSVMIYGSICIAIGSVCSEIRDAQGLMLPVTLSMMIPIMLLQPVLQAPDGGFARAVTFFPPATPIMLLIRNLVPPGLPLWELVLGVLVCLGFMIFTVWAAAKIFRIGILSQGQTPTVPKLITWVFSK